MFCAGAPDPVQGLICLLSSRSSMMVKSQVYTVLIGDHVVDLPSSILEQHIYIPCVLDIYPIHDTHSLAFWTQFLIKLTHFSVSLDLYHIIYSTYTERRSASETAIEFALLSFQLL